MNFLPSSLFLINVPFGELKKERASFVCAVILLRVCFCWAGERERERGRERVSCFGEEEKKEFKEKKKKGARIRERGVENREGRSAVSSFKCTRRAQKAGSGGLDSRDSGRCALAFASVPFRFVCFAVIAGCPFPSRKKEKKGKPPPPAETREKKDTKKERGSSSIFIFYRVRRAFLLSPLPLSDLVL